MDKLEKVAQAIAESDGNEWDTCYPVQREEYLDNARAASAALDPMNKPRVSPLVWTAKGYAQTPFGKYLVVRGDWSGQEDFWFVCFAGKPYGQCGEHSSEEAAKAAAQADYEARILAALEYERGHWVPMPDLARIAGAFAVHSRIADLRKRGHRISHMNQKNGRKVWSFYRLDAE